MKGIYIISTLGHGSGGHFHSLKATTEVLNDNVELIINIGLKASPIFEENKNKFKFIYFNGFNIVKVIRHLNKIINQLNPEFIHAFDDKAYLFSRITNVFKRKKQLLTKCGGPNIKYYPYCKDLILYSKENLNFYLQQAKFKKSNLHFIPNRLVSFDDDNSLIEEVKSLLKDKKAFLRISRITEYYEKGLIQSINLIDKLSVLGHNVVLFIIGVVESESVYQRIKAISSNVIIITDEKYTKNAKSVINAFDYVIGSGRGLMEASSKGKLLLSPSDYMEYPIFVDDETFNDLFKFNFSPRNKVEINNEENFNKIVKSLNNETYNFKMKEFILTQFKQNFSLESVTNKYIDIYKNANVRNTVFSFDIIPHFLYTMKEFIVYYYRSKNKG